MIDRTQFPFKMKDLITEEHKHLLWQDEIGDDFLITRWCEVYRFGKETLRLYVWGKSTSKMRGVVKNDPRFEYIWDTDDKIYIYHIKNETLPFVLENSGLKQRPYTKGKWIKARADHLGHDIKIYSPKLKKMGS